ncbi:MAG: tripartite tricarboxylate transporter substrate binding protein [Methylibium sp.]|nr:tripartite tricarboxylate transporter substrate binding protein [Methylibium sp.]
MKSALPVMRFRLKRLLLVAVCGLALPFAAPLHAQTAWPTKPVKMIVPFAPGGSTDVVARMLAQRLSAKWGQQVLVENRAGAGGNIGADVVAKSPADGYTLLMASGSITINPHLYAKMPFDTAKDLVPISNIAGGPMLVVVPDKSPIKSIKDLIATAKAKPGALSFGSAGVGSQVHLAAENLSDAAGIDMQHVPYKGEAPAYTDLIGGQTQVMVGNIAVAAALIGPDRLRALAVTGKERSKLLPDVPTVAESGLPGFENTGWFGLYAPAGTPPDVIAKVQRDSAAALMDTEIKARLFVLGMAPIGGTASELAKQMDTESVRWAQVVKSRKLKQN